MSSDLELLLAELRDSPTDLARIVTEVLRRDLRTLYVARRTVEGWETRDAKAWDTVRAWLHARNVRIEIRSA
jgi:hypothetical protein